MINDPLPIKTKKILVTGANGFIGSNLVRFLAKDKSLSVASIIGPGSNGQEIKGDAVDILDFPHLREFIQKESPEIVIHTAGYVDLRRDFGVSTLCVDANMKGTLNVLEACRLADVKKIIFPSSYEVYGKGEIPYREESRVNPPSMYSIAKLAGELMCNLYQELYGVNYTILRLPNVYGFGQPDARLIPNAIIKALAGDNIEISGNNKRDFLYMEDLLHAFYLAINNNLCDNRIINIGSGKGIGILEVVKVIANLLKSNIKIVVNPQVKRIGESEEMIQDISLAKEILGWVPQYSLEQGLKKTITYYKNKVLN